MPDPRPHVSFTPDDDGREAQVEQFVRDLDESVDAASFNRRFAVDIIWGNPDGGIVAGFEDLHALHSRILSGPMRDMHSRFTLVAVTFVDRDVAVAHVRREALDDEGRVLDVSSVSDPYLFHELTMYVLVWRDGEVWLAAAQNTPTRMVASPPTADIERIFDALGDPPRLRFVDQHPSSTNVARSSCVGHLVVARAAGLAGAGGSIRP